MKRGVAIALAMLVVGFIVGHTTSELNYLSRSPELIKQDLKQRKKKAILAYITNGLVLNTRDEGGIFSTKYVSYISGTLKNEATVAKDVRVIVDFFSKTKAPLGSENFTVYDYIQPGGYMRVKQKVKVPKDTEKYEVFILEAKAE